jgi:hypothetical protein
MTYPNRFTDHREAQFAREGKIACVRALRASVAARDLEGLCSASAGE